MSLLPHGHPKVQRQGEHLAFLLFPIPNDTVLSSTLSSSLGGSGWVTSSRQDTVITMPLPAQPPGLRTILVEGRGMRGRGAWGGLRAGRQELRAPHVQEQQPGTCPVLSTWLDMHSTLQDGPRFPQMSKRVTCPHTHSC